MRVVIGLGANLGDRLATMREAVARIGRIDGVRVTQRSRVYETQPVGLLEQPAFLNAAVVVDCAVPALVLLDALLRVERELGRSRGEGEVRWGPRVIDLDVLWIDGVVLDEPRLVVPHPRLAERAFAIIPLLEVAPGAVDPRTGSAYVAPVDAGVEATSLSLT